MVRLILKSVVRRVAALMACSALVFDFEFVGLASLWLRSIAHQGTFALRPLCRC